jgi:predicted transposase/invertase (TIGR01784 family)
LNKTIVISILDFIYFPGEDRHHRIVSLRDIETYEKYDGLNYMDLHFVELKKFKKELKDVKTTLDRWATFLNNAYQYEKDKIPAELAEDKEIKKAIEKLDVMYLNNKEREFYEAEQKKMRDTAEALRTAEEKGKENGAKDKAIEMARNLKENGVDISLIAGASGLSKEEIEKL